MWWGRATAWTGALRNQNSLKAPTVSGLSRPPGGVTGTRARVRGTNPRARRGSRRSRSGSSSNRAWSPRVSTDRPSLRPVDWQSIQATEYR